MWIWRRSRNSSQQTGGACPSHRLFQGRNGLQKCLGSPFGGGKGACRTTDLRKPKAFPRGVDSPYQGEMPRRGKGGRDSCRRRRLMRGRVLIFELLRVFEPNVAAAQNVQLFSSSGAPRHLPLKGKALVRRKPGGGIFTLRPKCARMAAVWGRLYDRASGGGCL